MSRGALEVSEALQFDRNYGRKNSKRAIKLELVVQIIEALEKLGGSAHRDVVAEQIARDRRIQDSREVERLRQQVHEIFVDHCEGPAGPATGRPLFRRMYGPDSRRWCFSKQIQTTLRQGSLDYDQLAL